MERAGKAGGECRMRMRENKLFTCVRGCVCSVEKVDEDGRQCCLRDELNLKKIMWSLHIQKVNGISVVPIVGCYGNKKGYSVS